MFKKKRKIEYKVLAEKSIDIDVNEDTLNQLGEEGWELVNVVYSNKTNSIGKAKLYFKR